MTLALQSPTLAATEHTMQLADGTNIFYRSWIPAVPTNKALVMFHRGHEHSGRLADVVAELGLEDVAVFAWDARGHGRSGGERGYAPSFAEMVRDVDAFMSHIRDVHGFDQRDTVVLAHSVGAVAVSTWVHDYAPRIRALVLATPAFKVKLYVPFAIPGLRLLQKLRRGKPSFVKSYVKATMLTHDEEQARRYDEDPLIARAIAVNVLLGMRDTARRVVDDAGAIRTPTLVLSGGSDWVVSTKEQRRFFNNLGSPKKAMRTYAGMYHDILHEKDRRLVLDEIARFVEEAFEDETTPAPLLDAHERGYTCDEHVRLARPLPSLSPRRVGFGIQKAAMNSLGRLSRGVRLGLSSGFDSGRTLDYVYANRASGALGLGRLIDRGYLDSIGWRGIRQRKVHLEEFLFRAIREVAAAGRPVRILDVATGAGRYVLDTIASMPELDIEALLRDFTPANLEEGRALARRMALDNVRYEQGDAFDEADVSAIDPAPNVGIVSGLYELFPDNDMVLASLRGLAAALARCDGPAYLVYTGQPWHPQLEMIGRVLTNRNGESWTMRRRTQEEMDDLVRAAGFEKIDMRIDDFGIFTVSLARIGMA
ncbi:MAG: bifunctional alpha/beta hydrolase/class I SAM-dependent methyltransferase [Planctomycetota bacterium]|jgi:alpha-beta hydrolase superfamily lysophospholipase/SAM-dependent methyltransferase